MTMPTPARLPRMHQANVDVSRATPRQCSASAARLASLSAKTGMASRRPSAATRSKPFHAGAWMSRWTIPSSPTAPPEAAAHARSRSAGSPESATASDTAVATSSMLAAVSW
jgi:hypothetical protein